MQAQATELTNASIEAFQLSISEMGLRPPTCRAYVANLRNLLRWYGQPALAHDDLESQAMKWLTGALGVSSSATIHQRRSSVTAYARWARVGGRDFMCYYRAPKKAPAVPHPFPNGMEDLEKILGVCQDQIEFTLVALCGLMGLRVDEAVHTMCSDIDIRDVTNPVLWVRDGKGGKPRNLPLYPRPLGYVLAVALPAGLRKVPLVPLSNDQARRRLKLLGVRAGLSQDISSHDYRSTFATDMHERTGNLLAVSTWLGHADLETTKIYVGHRMALMKAAVA